MGTDGSSNFGLVLCISTYTPTCLILHDPFVLFGTARGIAANIDNHYITQSALQLYKLFLPFNMHLGNVLILLIPSLIIRYEAKMSTDAGLSLETCFD